MSSSRPAGQGHGPSADAGAYFSPGRIGSGPASPIHPQSSAQGRGSDRNDPAVNISQQIQPGMDATGPEMGGGGGLSMGAMAASLPNYRPNQAMPLAQSVSRLPQGSLPNLIHPQQQQQQQMSPFAGQTSPGGQSHGPSQVQYLQQSYPHMQQSMPHQNYLMQQAGGQGQPGYPGGFPQHSFPSHPFQQAQQQPHSPAQPYMYYQQGYGQQIPAQFQGTRQSAGGFTSSHDAFSPASPGMSGFGMQGSPSVGQGGMPPARFNTSPSKAAIPSAPRGPPRKPKQSGHALWVGNLPPGALVQDLKDHFSREATHDIESVFLISKSNCAFVNYRTEAACASAMTRFHDSRFQGVRLVCRYRGTAASSPASATPSGPSAQSPTSPQSQSAIDAIAQNREISYKAEESLRQQEGGVKVNDKYFVVKSLTVEDLELSARNGIWATQAHNEAALNKAFESVDNVYLIFSANKSGEYFGYAKMVSAISDESASKLEWKPRVETVVDDPELPRSIPTPATETAPRGRIIDDSARGTIFWEVESSDSDDAGTSPQAHKPQFEGVSSPGQPAQTPLVDGIVTTSTQAQEPLGEGVAGPQAFGRPFKIEWVSTERLPFYRTRGLRNPWNANRDVKIARDGTELETSVGRRLVQMFHRATPVGPQQQPMSPDSPGMIEGLLGYQGMSQF